MEWGRKEGRKMEGGRKDRWAEEGRNSLGDMEVSHQALDCAFGPENWNL